MDASIALAWVLADEEANAALRLRDLAVTNPRMALFTPPNFWFEVANVLWVAAERRNRLSKADAMTALVALDEFDIHTWMTDPKRCLALSFEYDLAVYDAAYLAVALDRNIPLWTLDRGLTKAAREAAVVVEPD